MKIATWNINGVKARLDTALTYLKDAHLDVLCLQEIGAPTRPSGAFEELGYNVATHGQKGFNGVAILSKTPLEDVARGLPGAPDGGDAQSRYIEATLRRQRGGARRLHLPAERQSRHREVRLQTRLAGAPAPPRRAPSRRRDAARARWRLQRHPRTDRRQAPGGLGERRAVPAREPRRAAPATYDGFTDAVRSAIPSPASTRSGTTRPAAGRRTTASASTTCSRRKPPTASSRPRSTASRAAGRSRPTTCRCGSSSTSDAAGPEPQRPSSSFGSRGCAAAIRDLAGSLEAALSPSTSRIARTRTGKTPARALARSVRGRTGGECGAPIRNRAARGALFVV